MGGLLSAPPTTVKPGFAVDASVAGGDGKRGEESDGAFFMSRGDRFSKPSTLDFFRKMLIRALANVPYFCGKTAYEHREERGGRPPCCPAAFGSWLCDCVPTCIACSHVGFLSG